MLPPRLQIAQLPTPIRRLERISESLGGPSLWVKHDDDTGGVLSGNKIRKLQYVVHEALDRGADTLVTCGGLQSNHCRATALVARRLGLQVVLCLRGTEPERPEGNYLLDRLAGADIRHITPEQYQDKDTVMEAVAEELRGRGRKPFVIAEGASMATGAWGYIEACREIAEAQDMLGVRFDAIVHALGSGGTSAGLELGTRMVGLEAKVWGVNVCDDADTFRPLIHRIASQAIEQFGLPCEIESREIGIIDGYVGRGYAQSRPEELTTIVDAARSEGLVLDPVYTGKAFHALSQEITGARLADADNILFIHTGGVYGLMPIGETLPLS